MKTKLCLILLLISSISFSQMQIGADINGEAAFDSSGISVSLSSDGNIIAIGAPLNDGVNGSNSGHVRVYQNITGVWTQIGDDIDGEAAGDESGRPISLSSDGSIIAVGAPLNDGNGADSGHVRVYQNQSGTWTQIGADIDGEAAGDQSGSSVSLSSDGNIVAIGATWNDGNGSNSGHVRVFENQSGTWMQVGADIDGEAVNDFSGVSIDLSSDGSLLAIGAAKNDGNGTDSGHVRVYQNTGGTWGQIGDDIDGEAAFDSSGISISLSNDGSIVAIGARDNDGNGQFSGHVRVYQNIGGTWTQIGTDIDGEAIGDESGESVSLNSNGSIVAIGAMFNDDNGSDSGHVRIFQNQSGTWIQVGVDIDGEAVNDFLGFATDLSNDGNILAIGAWRNDSNGEDSGQVLVYDLSTVLSVENNTFGADFLVYPNPIPINSVINIKIQEVINGNWQIINQLGQLIKESEFNSDTLQIFVQDLNSGMYFLKITDSELNQSITKRIIVSNSY